MDRREKGDTPGGLGLAFRWAIWRTLRGRNEWFAIRSQRVVKRQSFAVAALAAGFLGEPAKLLGISREPLGPSGFVLQRVDDLRSDSVLLLFRKSGHFAQGFFEHLGHEERLANRDGPRKTREPVCHGLSASNEGYCLSFSFLPCLESALW